MGGGVNLITSPKEGESEKLKRGGWKYGAGACVMHLRKNYFCLP